MTHYRYGACLHDTSQDLHYAMAHDHISHLSIDDMVHAQDDMDAMFEELLGEMKVSAEDTEEGSDERRNLEAFSREEFAEAVEAVIVQEADEMLERDLDEYHHVSDGPCNGHGYLIGRYEDDARNSYVRVGEIGSLADLQEWIDRRLDREAA